MSDKPKTLIAYYTLTEAAERMRVSKETLKRAIARGDLRARKTGENGGGNTLLSSEALDTWFETLMEA